jgi:antitoxin HigA-1
VVPDTRAPPPAPAAELRQKRLTFNSGESPIDNGGISPDGKYLAYQHSIRINDQYRVCFEWGETVTWSRSQTTTEEERMARRKPPTIAAHPGEILRTEFIEPMGITAYQMAKALHFPGIYEILREQRAISADVALRLGKYFGMTPQFWMNLQTDYDLRLASASAPLGKINRAWPRSPRVTQEVETMLYY